MTLQRTQIRKVAIGLSSSQREALERFGKRINTLGANFAVRDGDATLVLLLERARYNSSKSCLTQHARQVLDHIQACQESSEKRVSIECFSDADTLVAGPLVLARDETGDSTHYAVACIDLGDAATRVDARSFSNGGNQYQLQDHRAYLTEMLGTLLECFESVTIVQGQMDHVGHELARTYEELVLIHKLNTNMKVTESDTNFLQMTCDRLAGVLSVEGIAVLLEKKTDGETQQVQAASTGQIEFSARVRKQLLHRTLDELAQGQEALLDSQVYGDFRFQWPNAVQSIIAVPLVGKESHEPHLMVHGNRSQQIVGVMVAINAQDKPEFDTTDIKLLSSVANGCAVFIENGRLFNEVSELFMGSLRALTNSIDAKDAYTHGHSERVAIISRWIAQHLAKDQQLRPEQIQHVYLAGLLHDIGKIGVDDSVLRKMGSLNDDEWQCIRKHPLIGAGILKGIKQLEAIVPGVLCHHEWINGRGYPNGLTGDAFPLIGRIVSLADAFDAMTSKRSYRNALSIDEALAEIKRNTGVQFDETVVRVFCESDINALWEILQYGSAETYDAEDQSSCALAAVEMLIK